MILLALLILAGAGGGAFALTRSDEEPEESASRMTTTRPSTTITTIAPTTSTSPPTTAPPRPTELQTDWTYEPYKCGIDFGASRPYPHSATRTYEATATTGLWSAPSTQSTLLITIPVTKYGPGGIGCPDGTGPYVTVQCKVTNGQVLSGPFGTYGTWVRATFAGVTGFAHDQWIDTEWDINTIPAC